MRIFSLALVAIVGVAALDMRAHAGPRAHSEREMEPRIAPAPPLQSPEGRRDQGEAATEGNMLRSPSYTPLRERERAQRQFKRCGAMPYAAMRNGVESQFQGRVVGQQFFAQQCQYKLMVLRPTGQVLAVSVDAQSGSILGVSGDDH